MASDTVTDLSLQTDEGTSPTKQDLQDIEDRLGTLSAQMTLCNQVLNDLKILSDILVRKSLHDASLQPQK